MTGLQFLKAAPMNSLDLFREIILRNECGGSVEHVYRFSDPDGVRSGKSGYSFGISQFDTQNNPSAILCLRECGFTTDEVAGVRNQTVDAGSLALLEGKLEAAGETVNRWDARQLQECLVVPSQICTETGVCFAEDAVLFHLADYHNQFYFSRFGKCHKYLLNLDGPVTVADVLALKESTAWGKKKPGDVARRYRNIVDVLALLKCSDS